jgi:GMP synthase (glutamine-hydrolysing)
MTRIVVIDNHGQFTHLEHRALRDMDIETALVDNTTPAVEINADGLVLSGGPDIEDTGRCAEYLDLDVPVLGTCLGMQFIARELGVPMVADVTLPAGIADGTVVTIDADRGVVYEGDVTRHDTDR